MQFYTFYKAGVPKASLPQLFRVMRITAFLILVTLLQVSASSYSQQLTMQKSQASLKEIFTQINIQTGYDVVVSSAQLKNTKKISVSFNKTAIQEVLDQVLKNQNLSYTISDKTIVITEKKEELSFLDKMIARFQRIDIKGMVVDSTGNPIAGATVKVKGFKQSTTTDNTGRFGLANVEDNASIVISFLGFKTIEMPASGNFSRVVLSVVTSDLEEVAIVNKGYYQEKKMLSTGSVSGIHASDIEKQNISNPLMALTGKVSGITINQTNGAPGSQINIQIRGQNSLINGSEPLFIIDGVPFAPGNSKINNFSSIASQGSASGGISPFQSINPQEIESIDVLKDADATAIYGSRGANGVILITTKKGKSGKVRFDANVRTGFSEVSRKLPLLNGQQYFSMRKEAFANDGIVPNNIAGDPGFAPDLTVWDTNRNTDWQDLLIGRTAKTTDANISLSGGSSTTKFLIGSGYHYDSNVFPGSTSDKRFSLNSSINHKSMEGKFFTDLMLNFSNDRNRLFSGDLNGILLPTNAPNVYGSDGTLNWEEGNVAFENPFAQFLNRYRVATNNILTNINVGYHFSNSFSFRTGIGYNLMFVDEFASHPLEAQNPIDNTPVASSQFGNSKFTSLNIEPQLDYKTEIGSGKLTALIGGTYTYQTSLLTSLTANGYDSDLLLESLAASSTIIQKDNEFSEYKYAAVYGRIGYSWDEKYILNLSGRRDGSSRFGPNQLYNSFGAVGAAWVFTNEALFQNNIKFLSSGKLRASYGVTGNDQIGNYKYLDNWTPTGNIYEGVNTLAPVSLFNSDYSWERNRKFDLAMELGFLKNKVQISANYFRNISNSQLVQYTLPRQTGFASITKNLDAIIQNSGFEFDLSASPLKGDFIWNTAFNLSLPKSKLVDFPNFSTSPYRSTYIIGRSVNLINLYNFIQIDPNTGIANILDVDANNVYNTADYQYGGVRGPKFYGGFTNNFKYKGFELYFVADFRKQVGSSLIRALNSSNTPGLLSNQPIDVLDRWQRSGDEAKYQKFTTSSSSPAYIAQNLMSNSNAAFTDASFIRLRTVSISYDFGKILRQKDNSSLKIYFQGQNLITITKYKGGDPETQSIFSVPTLRTITTGLQLNF